MVKNTLTFPRDLPSLQNPTSPANPPSPHGPVPNRSTVVGFLMLASIWMAVFDLALTLFWTTPSFPALPTALRALNFVTTAAILLFFVLRHAYNGWQIAEKHRSAASDRARQQFKRLSSRVQALREEDRTWIAREIHDELGQLLTGIKMQLRLIENRLSDREDRTLHPVIDKLIETSEMVDTTIASVQRISAGLRPSSLDHLGLATALTEEAGQFSQRTGIPCTVAIQTVPEILPPGVTTAAFRIFQESLTNIARHAQARRIDATFSVNNNLLELTIRDDGKGMDPSIIDDPKSLGLTGMRERAEDVGGLVTFSRTPRNGTQVTLTIPLPTVDQQPDSLR